MELQVLLVVVLAQNTGKVNACLSGSKTLKQLPQKISRDLMDLYYQSGGFLQSEGR